MQMTIYEPQVSRSRDRVREIQSIETLSALMQRYSRLSGDQKCVFNTLSSILHQQRKLDTLHPNENAFVLQVDLELEKHTLLTS